MKNYLELNKKDFRISKNRDPYLMIDYANKVIPGKIRRLQRLKKDEWFLKFMERRSNMQYVANRSPCTNVCFRNYFEW